MPTNISPPRAVVFDWDNTLIDNWVLIAAAMNDVRRAFGQEAWTLDETKRFCTRALRESFPDWYGQDWEKARDIFYQTVEGKHLDVLTVLPHMDEVLAFLHAQGVPLFVVTNKRSDLMKAEAKHLGWDKYFKALYGSFDAPHDKPARDPVDLALAAAGMKADDPSIWFIGDKPIDVTCARNAGLTPVLIHDEREALHLGVNLSFSDGAAFLQALQALWPSAKS